MSELWTPGPWTVQLHFAKDYAGRSHATVTAGALVPLAAVVLGVEGCSQDEGRANARLIACSPELYSALAEILDAWEAKSGMGTEMNRAVPGARAALDKARGETS